MPYIELPGPSDNHQQYHQSKNIQFWLRFDYRNAIMLQIVLFYVKLRILSVSTDRCWDGAGPAAAAGMNGAA